jgi:hypothetical protein
MPTQEEKYAVAMAGEHFVAAELLRRGLAASVTMGNAKRADVVVMNRSATRVVVVEVKSSSRKEWIVGARPPEPSKQPWVFVHLPEDHSPPQYFVLTAKDLHDILTPRHEAYRERYLVKHGKPYTSVGLIPLKWDEAVKHENRWEKITKQVKDKRGIENENERG